jgi:predicted RNA-binding Zn ribbon-like protein
MSETGSRAGMANLVGGRLCLDFANTADWHASGHPEEWLTSYADLVAWGRHVGVLSPHQVRLLEGEALGRPTEAAAVLRRAIALREAIYRLFTAVALGQGVDAADLAALNQALSDALARARVVPAGAGFAWDWDGPAGALDRVLWPVARSAAELLTSDERARVRQCAGDPCGWLFLDTSKNRSRRWCTMDSCGNRAKARRHYARTRRTVNGTASQ